MNTRTIEAKHIKAGMQLDLAEGNTPLQVQAVSASTERIRCMIEGGGSVTFTLGTRVRVVR